MSWKPKRAPSALALIWFGARPKRRQRSCIEIRLVLGWGVFYLFIYFHICVNVFQTNQNSDGASNLQTNWELELRIGNTTRRRDKATVLGVFVGPKLCKSRGDQREAARAAADAEIWNWLMQTLTDWLTDWHIDTWCWMDAEWMLNVVGGSSVCIVQKAQQNESQELCPCQYKPYISHA